MFLPKLLSGVASRQVVTVSRTCPDAASQALGLPAQAVSPLLCRQHKLYPAFGASYKAAARGPAFSYTSDSSSWNHHRASWQNLITVALRDS